MGQVSAKIEIIESYYFKEKTAYLFFIEMGQMSQLCVAFLSP